MEDTEKKVLTNLGRIENNGAIAMSYYSVYDKTSIKDGGVYDAWVYAPHAEYWSPCFGGSMIRGLPDDRGGSSFAFTAIRAGRR